MIIIKFQKTG